MQKTLKKFETQDIKNIHVDIQSIEYQSIHFHPEMEIILILKGNPTFTINSKQQTYAPKDIIIINPHESHAILSNKEPTTLLTLHLNPNFYEGFFPSLKTVRINGNQLHSENENLFLYTFLTLGKIYAQKEPFYQVASASYVSIMMNDIFKAFTLYEAKEKEHTFQDKDTERIHMIIEYIQNNYHEKITIDDLSNLLNLSPSYLSYFIKNKLNQTFTEFLTYIRYVNAKRLILEKEYNLVEISEMVGFSDYRYMNRAFNLHLNMTPKAFKDSIIVKPDHNTRNKISIQSNKEEMIAIIDKFIGVYNLNYYL